MCYKCVGGGMHRGSLACITQLGGHARTSSNRATNISLRRMQGKTR
ncbi:unnamed protein product [Timema podura]|uniref:Uncharacterized protein n=1 Tax=Timema podura TaxID=61482 RepID=A0ABN7NSG9_TIMPD|nr:unnamed protein product [Timema podura]